MTMQARPMFVGSFGVADRSTGIGGRLSGVDRERRSQIPMASVN